MALKPIKTRPDKTPAAPVAVGDGPDLAKKFMRENPAGSLPDPPEIVEGRDKPVVPIAEGGSTPPQLFDETPGDKPVEAVTPETPETPATPSVSGETDPAAKPADATPPVPQAAVPEAAKPVAAPAETPKLAMDAEYLMSDGSKWTGQQVTDALYERAEQANTISTLKPRAQEADNFRSLLGTKDFADAEARWKPFLERVAAAPPAQREFAERVLDNADPALIDYLQRSEQFFYSPEGGGFQRSPEAAKPAAPDPAIQRFERVATAMERQLINTRVQNERTELFARYPFMAHNKKAYDALTSIAGQYFSSDEKAGKSPLECRGLLDAMRDQAVFLDTMAIANAAARSAVIEPRPGVGAEALIPGSGPASAAGSVRQAPSRESYRGDDPKAAFLRDHPE
jgi:hypothetical protein